LEFRQIGTKLTGMLIQRPPGILGDLRAGKPQPHAPVIACGNQDEGINPASQRFCGTPELGVNAAAAVFAQENARAGRVMVQTNALPAPTAVANEQRHALKARFLVPALRFDAGLFLVGDVNVVLAAAVSTTAAVQL